MTKHSKKWFKIVVGFSLLLAVCLFPLVSLFAQSPAWLQDEPGGPVYMGGELLVKFKPNAQDAELLDVVRGGALGLIKHIHTDAMKAKGDAGVSHMRTGLPLRQALAFLKRHPAVEYAEQNWVYTHQDGPNDPYFADGRLWGMYSGASTPANDYGSHAVDAWAAGYTGIGSSTVYVGVIDEGMQYTHPDLSVNVDYADSRNFIDSPPSQKIYTSGQDSHGTHVAGTIGAVGNNGLGVVGVNWNVQIISGKFLGPNGGTTADAIEAIDYFTGLKTRSVNPLNIVALNNSWGGGGYSQALLDAIVRAAKQNILFVAAAGNGDALGRAINTDVTPFYPSCYDTTAGASYNSVISVTAIDSTGAKASWANYGATTVDLGAPGVSIYSTLPTDTYGAYSGTSMATPHVTGAIALYASTHAGASALEIRNAILGSTTATASLSGKTVTGGRLNLSTVIAPSGPPTSPPPTPTGLSASAGDRQVSLSWNASAGATSYNVKRGTTSGSYDTTFNVVGATSYLDTSVANGSTYYYVVSAVNSVGPSGNSTQVSATPQALPAAPTSLTATPVSRSQINLTWADNSSNETGFKIERSTNNRTFTQIATVGANATSYSNTGLSRSTTYYYRVRATNTAGNSGYSNTDSAKTPRN